MLIQVANSRYLWGCSTRSRVDIMVVSNYMKLLELRYVIGNRPSGDMRRNLVN